MDRETWYLSATLAALALAIAALAASLLSARRRAPADLAAIQSEIRAAFQAAGSSPAAPPRPAGAQLVWTEPGRLAVLSLGGEGAAAGIARLRARGISALIAAPGHPFPPGGGVEIILVEDATLAPLAARLRARLAAGEALAFHVEQGLSGAVAGLAAQLSSRRA